MRRLIPGRFRLARVWIVIALLIILLSGAAVVTRSWYDRNLGPASSSDAITYFTVQSGDSLNRIAVGLKNDNLIRNSRAFETYVRGRRLYAKMQAGTYALTPSMSTPQIVNKIVNGQISTNLMTILPGKTLADIKQAFRKAGYGDAEIAAAFDPAAYPDEPILANLPSGASLEGFLYPDSFQKAANTPAQTIVRESLEEMQAHLTPDITGGFTAQGLNVYQGVTLASIVYQESGDPASDPTIAQVFLSRLKQGMPLQSNVTANYAADLAGVARTVSIQSPYNTYLHTGLPPGPIGNLSADSLKAVAHPSATDYLYFIAGDDGTIHFSRTQTEHQQAISQYCHKLCAQ
jgi:UPF0755 protein